MSKLPSDKATTTIRLPQDIKEKLQIVAEHNRMSFSAIVIKIIEDYLKNYGDDNIGYNDKKLDELIAKVDDIHRMTKKIEETVV